MLLRDASSLFFDAICGNAVQVVTLFVSALILPQRDSRTYRQQKWQSTRVWFVVMTLPKCGLQSDHDDTTRYPREARRSCGACKTRFQVETIRTSRRFIWTGSRILVRRQVSAWACWLTAHLLLVLASATHNLWIYIIFMVYLCWKMPLHLMAFWAKRRSNLPKKRKSQVGNAHGLTCFACDYEPWC